jgi:hypothetical protein
MPELTLTSPYVNLNYITRNLFTKPFTVTLLKDDIHFILLKQYWLLRFQSKTTAIISRCFLLLFRCPSINIPAHEIKITAVHISLIHLHNPIIDSNVNSRVDSITFTMDNPLPESTLTLRQSRLYPPVKDFRFDLWVVVRGGGR